MSNIPEVIRARTISGTKDGLYIGVIHEKRLIDVEAVAWDAFDQDVGRYLEDAIGGIRIAIGDSVQVIEVSPSRAIAFFEKERE